MVAGAIRTDLILSAEIMVIALDDVASEPFFSRLAVMVIVGLVITVAVYGAVGLLVKMDDVGLHLTRTRTGGLAAFGSKLVAAMPKVMAALSLVGMVAMLWVGGHILLVGTDELGWRWPYDTVHHLQVRVEDAVGLLPGLFGWVTATLGAALVGVLVGGVIAAALHQVHVRRHRDDGAGHDGHDGHDGDHGEPAEPAIG